MKVIENFDFTVNDYKKLIEQLEVAETKNQSNNIINYESFMLVNPITPKRFPNFDEKFFVRYDKTLEHILHCYKEGWITSERQVFYTNNECMTTIQFVFRKDKIVINAFLRSSNLRNINQDIQFLNYFLYKNFVETLKDEVNVFVSMPHIFLDRATKVEKIGVKNFYFC